MFQYQKLFRIIDFPQNQNASRQPRPQYRSTVNFRKCNSEKAAPRVIQKVNLIKGRDKVEPVFQSDFKRKYNSVFSQMLRIKKSWQVKEREEKENHDIVINNNFYQRVGTSLVKAFCPHATPKVKSKYKLNLKRKDSVKEPLKLQIFSLHEKTHPFFEECKQEKVVLESKLEKELVLERKKSLYCLKSRKYTNLFSEAVGHDSTELKGWNNLEEILEDDLYSIKNI